MSVYTQLVAKVLFPLHEYAKGHGTVAIRREMERNQWRRPEQISARQVQRLRVFLKDIGRHVPYYRDLFEQLEFDPESVSDLSALNALPLLDKTTIRSNSDLLRADNASSLQSFNTGGSSGEPLVFQLGKERISHDVAAKWRATRWWNVDIGDSELVLWGSPIELGSQDRLRLIRDKLFRSRLLSAFELSAAKIAEYLDLIAAKRPAMLFGYPSAFSLLAEHARRSGKRMDNLGIKVVFVTSERLYDHQRQLIEQTFACPVANGYGGRDAGFIAHQCPQGSLHITADDIVVEILDEAGRAVPQGTSGEIVVTHMATRDFPFVRYRTGDVGALSASSCSCGRGLPVLASVEGRSTDFVVAADGTRIHGLALIYILREMPEVSMFRIEQQSISLTKVSIVAANGFDEASAERIEQGFRQRLGNEVSVEIDLVDSISAEKSGKFRYVVSRVTT
ncbi:phenylacetate--CoA ligase family protein [Parahaliea sp. F7430]|uniref:Phenylacetate--CoA ligase family protein n=1 Tax=Sediminihaliea albiluteola TaxID=2758564 RepID=A0A7W2YJ36_9GAMM|nr:AMP-binding protein [Sediminihaliea albiluteola]MBA6412702.1 phenylacetate--CoA ligase family protein [Sediminihaliea albiluteola]